MQNFSLLIVESPAKAKTIQSYLDKQPDDWIVKYTKGHIVDLPKDRYALSYSDDSVDGEWEIISKDTKRLMEDIKSLAQKAESIFIATDDDREGERIASDVAAYLGIPNYSRVTFREITQKAIIQELYKSIRKLDQGVIAAATANRIIDREIGYPISTILSRTYDKELTKDPPRGVGRVISPSLWLICERERQRELFESERYIQFTIDYSQKGISFNAYNDVKFRLSDEVYYNNYMAKLKRNIHTVDSFEEVIQDITPPKPLNTPALQYSAWYIHGIMPDDAMKIAQSLFEKHGLITYHRTDSRRLAKDAVAKLRDGILEMFGEEYLSNNPKYYTSKPKGNDSSTEKIQDAHEAIRPTMLNREYYPKNILSLKDDKGEKRYALTPDELNIYRMIWARSLMSQMANTTVDNSTLEIKIGSEIFNAKADEQIFDGWKKISEMELNATRDRYEGSNSKIKQREKKIPKDLTIGQSISPIEIKRVERDTIAPKRYGVGTFIQTVYTLGFARPSTIGTLVKALQGKKYIKITGGIIDPTRLGMEVDKWTKKNFPWLNDIEHAKVFEESLQQIEAGEGGSGDDLVLEYHRYVREGAEKLGIDLSEINSNLPSSKQIEYAKKISKDLGIVFDNDMLSSKAKIGAFIKKHTKKKTIKRCIYCKRDGDIVDNDTYFSCSNKRGCDFMITKKRITSFFERFKVILKDEDMENVVKKLASIKGEEYTLITKENKPFKTVLTFKKDSEYGWQVSFKR